MKKIAVIISGCGAFDGAEIFETVFTSLELDKNHVNVKIFAPNKSQYYVINHLTQETMSEERNILVEAARIARGKIQPLEELDSKDFDALILPGGYGSVINLSNVALENENGNIIEDLKKIIIQFHEASKPIGAICISPVLLALALKNKAKIKITLGEKNELINKIGATEETCTAYNIVVDEDNKLITTPAFMSTTSLTQIHIGIRNLVSKIIELCEKTN